MTYTSALATFWWISELANRVSGGLAGDDERLGLVRARGLGRLDDLLGEPQRLLGIAADAVLGALMPRTPTRTLRNRAPGHAVARRGPVWPGSPLPQFGVPHICQRAASPTASIDRHSSYVIPV